MKDLSLQGIGMTSQRTRDRLIARLSRFGIQDQAVLEVMRTLPRHLFVDEALAHRAYEDTALPIGFQQTISQPFIVARMTEALRDGAKLGKVLEVGTGSGYQTAVLAQLATWVFSVERVKPLQDKARARLKQLGLRNFSLRHVTEQIGWPDAGPFDAVMVTAAPEQVPKELLDQLAEGGNMLIPVGQTDQQELLRLKKTADGIQRQVLEQVRFVPFVSGVALDSN